MFKNTKSPDELEQERLSLIENEVRYELSIKMEEANELVNFLEDNSLNSSPARGYRQALRDVINQEGFPESVLWPEKPSYS